MIKQASAVMTLLKELVGLDTVVDSSIVKTVKRGCVRAAGDRVANKGKKERTVMTIDHIKLLMGKFYIKTSEVSVFQRQEIFASSAFDVFQDEKIR